MRRAARLSARSVALSLIVILAACGAADGGSFDGGSLDGGSLDGGPFDGGSLDGGSFDGGSLDGGSFDGGSFDGGSFDGGSFDGGSLDAGSLDGGSPYPATSPEWPQIPNHGGAILEEAHLVTVTFNGYRYVDDVEAFGDWILRSSYWTTIGADYGIKAGKHVQKVRLSDSPQTAISGSPRVTDSQLATYLSQKLTNGTLPIPATSVDGGLLRQPLYAVFFPAEITLLLRQRDGSDLESCQGFGGYHSNFTYTPPTGPATEVSFVALPLCPPFMGQTELQALTTSASHEYVEAASNAFPSMTHAYSLDDGRSPWAFIPGEAADLCYTEWYVEDAGYAVQPIWSNAAALASGRTGQDPCVPNAWGNHAYVNVAASPAATTLTAAGTTVTVSLTAFTSARTDDWFMIPLQVSGAFSPSWTLSMNNGQQTTSAHPSYVQLNNGVTGTLTLSVPSTAARDQYAFFYLTSVTQDYTTTGAYSFWPVAVYVQ